MTTMKDRIFGGKLFTDMCEGMPEERTNAKKLQLELNNSSPEDPKARMEIIQKIFGTTEAGCWIEPPFYFAYGTHIKPGNGVYINVNCTFIDDGLITLGDHVMFGPCVTIATVGHPINPEMRMYMYTDAVEIGNNCWIGANAVICPGVHIGDNTVIGAGSIVTSDIPANVVAAGNPCRVIREINEHDMQYYYKDRPFDEEDLAEEKKLRGE